jgi:hypothetical protein
MSTASAASDVLTLASYASILRRSGFLVKYAAMNAHTGRTNTHLHSKGERDSGKCVEMRWEGKGRETTHTVTHSDRATVRSIDCAGLGRPTPFWEQELGEWLVGRKEGKEVGLKGCRCCFRGWGSSGDSCGRPVRLSVCLSATRTLGAGPVSRYRTVRC